MDRGYEGGCLSPEIVRGSCFFFVSERIERFDLRAVLRLICLFLRLLFHVFCYPFGAVVLMCQQQQQAVVALVELNQHTDTKGVVLRVRGGVVLRSKGESSPRALLRFFQHLVGPSSVNCTRRAPTSSSLQYEVFYF